MITPKYPIIAIATFLWIGFVCAISFLEAWLKFRAPGITIPLGLGIGRLVFGALNKIEWVFAIVILIVLLVSKAQFSLFQNWLFIISFFFVILQSVWLLPNLDVRAEMLIQGLSAPPSNLHYYYVGMELIKVVSLSIFGIYQFKVA